MADYQKVFDITVTVEHREMCAHRFTHATRVFADTYDGAVRSAMGQAMAFYSPEVREKLTFVGTQGELYATVYVPAATTDREKYIVEALASALYRPR